MAGEASAAALRRAVFLRCGATPTGRLEARGTGRNAGDNNTLFADVWVAF